jgi:hypothetical protein
MFAAHDIVIFAIVAGIVAAVALALLPWRMRRGRFAIGGLTSTLGFIAWNLTLNATDATGFNVDAPIIPLSWADAGSGMLAFVMTAVVFGLVTERDETALRVVGVSGFAGLAAVAVDLFVL